MSFLIVPILSNKWELFFDCMLGFILTYGVLSWRGMGDIKFYKCRLLVVDLIVYFLIGLIGNILILY